MQCKEYENQLIEASERTLSQDELAEMAEHTDFCHACVRFRDDLSKIRSSLKKMPSPSIPQTLEESTKTLCLERLKKRERQKNLPHIPSLIWTALILLTALTAVVLFLVIKDFKMELPLSRKSVAVLILLMQNAVMLFFAPIILRKFRSQEKQWSLL